MGKFCSVNICIAIICSVFSANASVIFTSLDRSSLSVGDQLRFVVSTIVPKGAKVIPPETDNGFGKIAVNEWNIKKSEGQHSDSVNFDYLITTYTPENCTIPSLSYVVVTDGKTDTLHSELIPLKFLSVITTDSATIKDLKPLQTAGKAPKIWLWTLLFLALVGAGIAIYRAIAPKFRKVPQAPLPMPPYEEAIGALTVLEAKKMVDKGLIREYVFELSDIYKRYISRRYEINAEEFTTEEMIAWLGASNLDKKLRSIVEWFFRSSDPVKFARLIPDQKKLEQFLKEVRAFIESTKPIIESSATQMNLPKGTTVSSVNDVQKADVKVQKEENPQTPAMSGKE